MPGDILYEEVAHAIQSIDSVGEENLSRFGLTYTKALIGSVSGQINLDAITFVDDKSTAEDMLIDNDEAAELGFAKSSAEGSTTVSTRLIGTDDVAEVPRFDPEELMDCEYLF